MFEMKRHTGFTARGWDRRLGFTVGLTFFLFLVSALTAVLHPL
jgi:hypothetical protein